MEEKISIIYKSELAPKPISKAFEYFKELFFDAFAEKQITAWVAGGCLRDYFSGIRRYNDIDLYFPDAGELKKCMDLLGGTVLVETDCAYKIKPGGRFGYLPAQSVDLVKIHSTSPDRTIQVFDFTVACAAINSFAFYHHEDFFMDLAAKRLSLNAKVNCLKAMGRLQKYIQKGYTCDPENLIEFAKGIHEVDISKPENLNVGAFLDYTAMKKRALDLAYKDLDVPF